MSDEATVIDVNLPDASFAAGVDADFSIESGGVVWDVSTATALLVLAALGILVVIRKGF